MLRFFSFLTFFLFLSTMLLADQEVKEKVSVIKDKEAVLTFELPQKATVQFFYADTFAGINAGMSYLSIEPDKKIEVPLSGLKPGTIYYFHANFYDDKNQRLFYRISWLKTTGRAETTIYSFKADESLYSSKFSVLVNNPGTAKLQVEQPGVKQEIVLTQKEKSVVSLDLGATESVYVYEGMAEKLKPEQKGKATLTFTDDKGLIRTMTTDFETCENNVAFGEKVEGTFNGTYIADNFVLEGDILSRVVDGNMDYKSGMAVSKEDPSVDEQWILIDLGKSYPIKDVQTFWRALAYPLEYQVLLSQDMKKWSAPTTVKNDLPSYAIGSMPMKVSKADMNGRVARYVKLMVPKGTKCYQRFDSYKFVQLVECKVHPKE